VPREDHWSFRRSRWFEHVGNESRHVLQHVGLLDMTAFAKARVSGPGAEAFLDRLVANRLPQTIGRVALCHALAPHGGVHSEFTIEREGPEEFYLVSAGALQRLDHDWAWRQMPRDGSVRFENLTAAMGVLVVAGPKSRELLQAGCSAPLDSERFPWLTGQRASIGMAPVKLLRLNFVGELGWEIHHGIEYQNHIFDALMEAGEPLALRPFGIRAMDALRIEKSYRMIGTELSIEYAALESGLERFVHPDKGDFIGREGLLEWRERGFRNAFATLEVHGLEDADPLGNNPLYVGEELVGRSTGGNYGFRVEKSLALAMLRPDLAIPGTSLQIEVLGERYEATVLPESPYDPENRKLRA
jgi:dimethylglycine dehydrogenase